LIIIRLIFETTLSEIDLVLDTMAGEVQRKSITVLKPEGRLISILSIDEDPRIQKKGFMLRLSG
jgi:hypothetical protein